MYILYFVSAGAVTVDIDASPSAVAQGVRLIRSANIRAGVQLRPTASKAPAYPSNAREPAPTGHPPSDTPATLDRPSSPLPRRCAAWLRNASRIRPTPHRHMRE